MDSGIFLVTIACDQNNELKKFIELPISLQFIH